jgi:hypothetical protein
MTRIMVVVRQLACQYLMRDQIDTILPTKQSVRLARKVIRADYERDEATTCDGTTT